MQITFLGHSCFLISDGSYRILTDPYISGDPLCPVSADRVEADYIFVTHGHHDHVGDTAAIAKRCGSTVCCTADLASAVFASSGIKTKVGNLGGTIPTAFGSAKLFQALHGGGAEGVPASGFIFNIGGKKIYHAGDTALMSDMALLADESIDLALLPIGDLFTMGPDDALRAVKLIRPKLVVPMHYDTFPGIAQDAGAFAADVRAAGFDAKVLRPGDSLSL